MWAEGYSLPIHYTHADFVLMTPFSLLFSLSLSFSFFSLSLHSRTLSLCLVVLFHITISICSNDYWIGLAQVNDNNVYWVDGTQFNGSYIPAGGAGNTKCIKANVIERQSFELQAIACGARKMFICEDVAPPGKWAHFICKHHLLLNTIKNHLSYRSITRMVLFLGYWV